MNKEEQQQKEKLAPNYWKLIKVWEADKNDVRISKLHNTLTKEEAEHFKFYKLFNQMCNNYLDSIDKEIFGHVPRT